MQMAHIQVNFACEERLQMRIVKWIVLIRSVTHKWIADSEDVGLLPNLLNIDLVKYEIRKIRFRSVDVWVHSNVPSFNRFPASALNFDLEFFSFQRK